MGPFSLVHFHRKSQIINMSITQKTSKENVAKKSWFQTVLCKRITEATISHLNRVLKIMLSQTILAVFRWIKQIQILR